MQPAPNLYAAAGRGPRAALAWEVLEAASGLALAGFLWLHVAAVSSVIWSPATFNAEAEFLERTYLAHAGIPLIVFLLLAHMVLAGRRMPMRAAEQQIAWRHARTLGRAHGADTWSWLFQAVSGVAVGLLAAIHVWAVVSHWTISVPVAAGRVSQGAWFGLYLLLLALALYHAAVGLYRMMVKWVGIARRPVWRVLHAITLALLALGIAALVTLRNAPQAPGPAGAPVAEAAR